MSIKHVGRTIEQASAELGVSEDRLRELIVAGVLTVDKVGRAILVDLPDTFTTTATASIIGVTTGRIRQLIRGDEIKATKFGPQAWMIELREIRRFNLTPKAETRGRPRISSGE